VESIASHAGVVRLGRQREPLGDVRTGAMERGIEACDLRKIGESLLERADRRQVVWLVQWSQPR